MAINLTPITKTLSTSTNKADKVFNNQTERDIAEIDPGVVAAAYAEELARLKKLNKPLATPNTTTTPEEDTQPLPEAEGVVQPIIEAEDDPFTVLGLKDPGNSYKAQKEVLNKLETIEKDWKGVTITDAQRIRAVEKLKLTDMSKMEAGVEQNIYVLDNMFNKAYTEVNDPDWVLDQRDAWFETNKPYLSPQFIEAWEEDGDSENILNEADAETMVARYEREHALTEKIFEDGFWEGMGVNVVTGLASPQDAWMYGLPFVKAGKTLVKFVEDVNKWKQVLKGGLVGSGVATYSEGTRQTLAGIDLNDEYAVAAIGFFFGGTVEGIRAGWNRMTDVQKLEFSAHVNDYARLLEKQSKIPTTESPKDVPINTAHLFSNPSPLERLYSTGLAEVYNIISKIKSSTLNLSDSSGQRVVQKDVTAWELNELYQGRATVVQAKLLKIIKSARNKKWFVTKGIKTADFESMIDVAFKATTLASRNRDAEKALLKSQIDVIDKAITKLEKPKKAIKPATALKHKKQIEGFNNQKKVLESQLKDIDINFKPHEIENPLVKEAVIELQAFYKTFNDDIWRLDKRDLEDAFMINITKLNDKLDGLTDEKAIAKLEVKLNKLEVKYNTDLADLDATMLGRQDNYNPRYWSPAAIGDDIEASVTAITNGLIDGPQAKALKKYDPEAYAELVKNAPTIARNMVEKIDSAEYNNTLLDIAGMPLQGQSGGKFNAKSGKQRKIDVDETAVGDLVNTNWNTTLMSYTYDMGRTLSTREALGIKNPKEYLEKYLKKVSAELLLDPRYAGKGNARKRERILADLADMVDEALGVRGKSNKPNSSGQIFKRTMMNVNNIYFALGFLPAQIGELGPGAKVGGLKFFKQLAPGMKKAWGEYRDKGFNEDDIDALNGINMGGMIQKSEASARLEDGNTQAYSRGEPVSTLGKMDTGIHWAANKAMTAGAMPFAVTSMRYAASSSYMIRVHRIATKMRNSGYVLTRAEANYFARNGLEAEDFMEIAKQPLKDSSGNQNYNLSGWDTGVSDLLHRSTMRATNESILNPSGYDIPKFMSNVSDITGPMLSQYLRFPIASYNALLKTGMSDRDARSLTSILISYTSYATTIYMQEQMAISVGLLDKSDAKYDLDTDEGLSNLFWKATSYNPTLASGSKPLEILSSATGIPMPGQDYAGEARETAMGAGGSIAFRGLDALRGILQDGEFNKSARFLMSPGDTHFIAGGGVKKLKDWLGDEYLDPIASNINDVYSDTNDTLRD